MKKIVSAHELMNFIENFTDRYFKFEKWINNMIIRHKLIENIDFYKCYNDYAITEITAKKILQDTVISQKESTIIAGIPQYPILNYRIDYYIPNLKIAIEYDENNHKNYSYEAQEGRQKEIEKELGCRFIRVSDKQSYFENVKTVINKIDSYMNT